jgi:lipopolysaccharide export system permease protein
MRLIYRYLLAATTGPMMLGFFVITFVLLINRLQNYISLFVAKGVAFNVATEVLLLSLGHMFALSIPMSVLIGILMGIGQLTADNEITAMKANGIGLLTILRPLLIGGMIMAIGLAAFNHYVLPKTNHRLATLLYNINHARPMMEVSRHQFIDITPDVTIRVDEKDDKTNHIEGVTLIQREGPGDTSPTITTATWGTIVPLHAQDAMRIELHDGEIHEIPDDEPGQYKITRFDGHNILLHEVEKDLNKGGRKTKGDREMDLNELSAAAAEQKRNQLNTLDKGRELALSVIERQWDILYQEERPPPKHTRHTNRRRNEIRNGRGALEKTTKGMEFQQDILLSYISRENSYIVEYQKKLAIPVACIVFVLMGVPMALTTSRSGKSVSVGLALAMFTIYYLFLIGGEQLADRRLLDPVLAMWMANIVLTAISIPLLLRTIRESSLLALALKPPAPVDANRNGD